MRKKTKELLSQLCKEQSRASLVNLWSDIRSLTKDEFIAALGQLAVPPVAKAAGRTKSTGITAKKKLGSPAGRIAAVASDNGVPERDVQMRLVEVLIERGYPVDAFPKAADKSLETWLDELMLKVPSSEVVEAATKLLQQPR